MKEEKVLYLKIAQEIVISQQSFFHKGSKYIKPLRMKDIAQKLNFHESTISRGVNGKYMLTLLECLSLGIFLVLDLKMKKKALHQV